MMKLWRRRGVDQMLRRAAAAGTVLAGVSAGAICWCLFGVSDSAAFSAGDRAWNYIAVTGLGLIDIGLAPHFDVDPRRRAAAASIAARKRSPVIGLDDCTALQVIDDKWRVLSCRESSHAHVMYPSGASSRVAATETFKPLSELSALGQP